MSTLTDIRAAFAVALRPVIQSYPKVPASPVVPCAFVASDDIEYDTDFDGGAIYRIPVQFLTTLTPWDDSQTEMDDFIAHDGTAVAALLDDTGYETRVTGVRNYGATKYGVDDYMGAQVLVEVIV